MTADNAAEADARWAAARRRGETFSARGAHDVHLRSVDHEGVQRVTWEVWPKPGPRTRSLRARRWARLRASFGGYFWLPCPLCGQMFGGQEAGDLAVYDDPEHPATETLVCPAHDPVWPDPEAA